MGGMDIAKMRFVRFLAATCIGYLKNAEGY